MTMAKSGVCSVVTQDDDMDFFRTFFKYTSKMTEFDNFEFREAAMALVKKYMYKHEMEEIPNVKEKSATLDNAAKVKEGVVKKENISPNLLYNVERNAKWSELEVDIVELSDSD